MSGEPLFIGVSLKMYFDHERTLSWCDAVRDRLAARQLPADAAELVVLPSLVSLDAAGRIFDGAGVGLGAQNVFWEDAGAYTGEVSAPALSQVGCDYVEVGHAERRRIFGEDDGIIAAKTTAAIRNGLTPILCVGEPSRGDVDAAATRCIADIEQVLAGVVDAGEPTRIVVAYEPEWAIGAQNPAPVDHIAGVCGAIRDWLAGHSVLAGSRVIYGGSAGPGLLTRLNGYADGLFLGRFAHDPDALDAILAEAVELAA